MEWTEDVYLSKTHLKSSNVIIIRFSWMNVHMKSYAVHVIIQSENGLLMTI